MITKLVFSGGGVKCFIFLGFIKALEEKDLIKNIDSIIGTSAGSMMAALLCLDYKYNELEEIFISININNFKNINSENILKFFDNYGIDDGEKFSRIIYILLKAKTNNENITFKELYDLTNKKLIISATCVNTMNIEYFDYINNPSMKIHDAIMMSICVPMFYKPIEYNGKLYVDGGVIKHYPIEYFKEYKKTTLGIMISGSMNENNKINNLSDYLYLLFSCQFVNLLKYDYELYKNNTILIENNISFVDFDLEYNTKINLIDIGYKKTINYIESNIFKEYFQI